MKKSISNYLKTNFPESGIETFYGSYWIRFELGGQLENGSIERVNQVVERALEIYKQTLGKESVVMFIEEYSNDLFDQNNENKDYLYSLIEPRSLKSFTKYPGPLVQTYFETSANGVKTERVFEDKIECDLLVGQTEQSDLQIEKVIRGMANLEMGIKPCIPQKIYFFNPKRRTTFYMYDDRGCDVWSENREDLIQVYHNLNHWILNYNREEVDSQFL